MERGRSGVASRSSRRWGGLDGLAMDCLSAMGAYMCTH